MLEKILPFLIMGLALVSVAILFKLMKSDDAAKKQGIKHIPEENLRREK